MSKKIKNITVIADFPTSFYFDLHKQYKKDDTEFIPLQNIVKETEEELLKKFFKIEYEKKPKILKRADGSLISEPEEEVEVLIIKLTNKSNYVLYNEPYCVGYDLVMIKSGKVFLPEDKDLAEKKAKMLTKQLEIQYEIDRLDAEERRFDKAYFWLDLEKDEIGVSRVDTYRFESQKYMEFKTAEIILQKYSQNELKQYLGIII